MTYSYNDVNIILKRIFNRGYLFHVLVNGNLNREPSTSVRASYSDTWFSHGPFKRCDP